MTLRSITDYPKHFAFMQELRERCAAECLNIEADFNEKGEDIVRRVEEKMRAEGWKDGT